MNINFLRIPIGHLYDIDDLKEFPGFRKTGIESFISGYEEHELEGIIEALKWAVEHPSHDFSSMLPAIKHNNKDIYVYLCKFNDELSHSLNIKK